MRIAGLGSIDVSAIAQAAANHQVHANAMTGEGYDPPAQFTFAGKPDQTAGWEYLHDDIAQQMASLLGATLVKRKPSNYPGTVPLANFLALPGGIELSAGSLAQEFTASPSIYGLDTECGYERIFANDIPDAVMSAKCQAQFNSSQQAQATQAVAAPSSAGQNGHVASQTVNYRNGQLYFGDTPDTTNSTNGTVSTAGTAATTTAPPSGQQVTTSTPGASVGSSSGSSGTSASSTSTSTSASSLGSLPWWVYAGVGVAALFMFKKD